MLARKVLAPTCESVLRGLHATHADSMDGTLATALAFQAEDRGVLQDCKRTLIAKPNEPYSPI